MTICRRRMTGCISDLAFRLKGAMSAILLLLNTLLIPNEACTIIAVGKDASATGVIAQSGHFFNSFCSFSMYT